MFGKVDPAYAKLNQVLLQMKVLAAHPESFLSQETLRSFRARTGFDFSEQVFQTKWTYEHPCQYLVVQLVDECGIGKTATLCVWGDDRLQLRICNEPLNPNCLPESGKDAWTKNVGYADEIKWAAVSVFLGLIQ